MRNRNEFLLFCFLNDYAVRFRSHSRRVGPAQEWRQRQREDERWRDAVIDCEEVRSRAHYRVAQGQWGQVTMTSDNAANFDRAAHKNLFTLKLQLNEFSRNFINCSIGAAPPRRRRRTRRTARASQLHPLTRRASAARAVDRDKRVDRRRRRPRRTSAPHRCTLTAAPRMYTRTRQACTPVARRRCCDTVTKR